MTTNGEINTIAFVVLLVAGGQVGISIILLTILCSRKITRHVIFFNFCATWMLFSFSYLLLFYAGELDNPHPRFSVCIAQAAMGYGAAPMASVSSFIFILHIFLIARNAILQYSPCRAPRLALIIMLVTPYIVYLIVVTVVLIVGYNHPHRIIRSTHYCHSDIRPISMLGPGMAAVAAVGVLIIEITTACMLLRHWRAFRQIGGDPGLSIHFMVRAAVFTLFAFLALLACIGFLVTVGTSIADFVIALLPLAVFLIFGTQPQLLRTWYVCDNSVRAQAPQGTEFENRRRGRQSLL